MQIREDLSAISGWPTIPQVFVKGELVGGADIVEELERSGELEQTLDREARRELLGRARRAHDRRCRASLSAGGRSGRERCEHVVGVRRRLHVRA